ncbi:MAG: fluoride efflux transporter CrcB [Thermodesulfobacteriota bacterium]
MKLFIIGIGGFIGSVSRYLVSGFFQGIFKSISFPYGTFMVNLIGCFFIGLFAHLSDSRGLFSDSSRAFVFIGLLGGFTTFSAFSNETFNLLHDGETPLAVLNILVQVVICLGSVWFGRAVAFWIWR